MEFGKWLYFAGIVLILMGVLVNYYPGMLAWFGKLPGDVRIQNERFTILVPITSMIIASVVITLCARFVENYLSGPK